MSTDVLLIQRVRAGDQTAWGELIARYEGRLLGYVEQRLRDRATAEDVVQETLIGFLTALPNYEADRPLENFLFSIASYKLTDALRRAGRRPTVALPASESSPGDPPLPHPGRAASALARSGERKSHETAALTTVLKEILTEWRAAQEWGKLRAVELLFVVGAANKDVAARLGLSEQAVANRKSDFFEMLRRRLRKLELDPEIFPELGLR